MLGICPWHSFPIEQVQAREDLHAEIAVVDSRSGCVELAHLTLCSPGLVEYTVVCRRIIETASVAL